MARRKSMSIKEEDAFKIVLDELTDEIISYPDNHEIDETIDWLKEVIQYNVPHGKQIRGRGVVAAYRAIVNEPKREDIKLTYIVGWCIEIFQACFLMADDVIDNSETRRGNPCWYLVDDIGDMAINDAFILNGVYFHFLDTYFFDKSYYTLLTDLFHDIFMKTSLGQCMDIVFSKDREPSDFTMHDYRLLVIHKTCYYTFYFPVACAMIMAGNTSEKDLKAVEEIVLDIGHLFQVQDDYLDCYGDPEETGKIGNDIAENKCSWMIIRAFEMADPDQKRILKENYGNGEKTTKENTIQVMLVFKKLKIREEYDCYEKKCYIDICRKIENSSGKIPQQVFQETADVIYRRRK